jgi:hypothetical protein
MCPFITMIILPHYWPFFRLLSDYFWAMLIETKKAPAAIQTGAFGFDNLVTAF